MKSRLTILAAAAVLAAVFLASCRKVYLGDIEDRLDKVERTVDSLSGIKTGVQTISYELTALAADVDALRERISTQPSGGDASRVQALEEAVRNLQAWASSLDGIGATIEGINTALATHSDSLSTLDASLRGADAAISALQAQVEAVQSALEAASQDPGSGAAVAGLIASVNALEPKVSTLESTVATLQESLSSLIGRVENVELELADIDDQIAGIGTTIADLRTAVDALQASSGSSSAQVQTAIAALEARIAALEQLQESLATKDWAEATFATLAAQQQTAADLAGVQAAVSAALAGMPEGKTVTDAISEAIAAASQSVKSWVNEQLAGYYTIGTIDGKLSDMKAALDAELTAAAADIDRVENDLRTLNTDLSAAIAAKASQAEVDAIQNEISGLQSTLSTLQDNYTALSSEVQEHQAEIAALEAALEAAKADIMDAYEAAINAAKAALEQDIEALDGKITANKAEIDAVIAEANEKISALEQQVLALESEIDALKTRLTAVENDVAQLKAMVQSVVFVPKYTGGSAVVKSLSELNSFTLEYEILPVEAAKEIPTAWASDNDILVLNSRTVLTRSGLASIPITGVEYNSDSKLLEVSVSLAGEAETLLSSDRALAVSLTVNTGGAMVSSPFTDIDNGLEFENLSAGGTANCYIVKEAGAYKFNATVRGNGKKTSGYDAAPIALTGATAQVLWESFGTADTPAAGSLVNLAVLDGDNVLFTATSNTGNAVIAVKDAGGNILWSWHIWLAGELPQDQVYNNDAGTMMDRNLGATSAAKGNPGALGLLYQWGRKDPFLGGNGISSSTQAASTGSWSTTDGPKTVDEAVKNPTTFYKASLHPYDWTSSQDNNLWKSSKTMYDPCPAGYRVPDGGNTGVWKKAGFVKTTWDSGYNFNISGGTTWYPAAGYRRSSDGTLLNVGTSGIYWSCSHYGADAYFLNFSSDYVNSENYNSYRASGHSVRCLRE